MVNRYYNDAFIANDGILLEVITELNLKDNDEHCGYMLNTRDLERFPKGFVIPRMPQVHQEIVRIRRKWINKII